MLRQRICMHPLSHYGVMLCTNAHAHRAGRAPPLQPTMSCSIVAQNKRDRASYNPAKRSSRKRYIMAHHCDNGIMFRHRWAAVMFCIISMTFQVSKQTPCSTWKECDAGPGKCIQKLDYGCNNQYSCPISQCVHIINITVILN